jgi:hypothetical protein
LLFVDFQNIPPPGNPPIVDIGFIITDVLSVDDGAYTVTIKVRSFNQSIINQLSINYQS